MSNLFSLDNFCDLEKMMGKQFRMFENSHYFCSSAIVSGKITHVGIVCYSVLLKNNSIKLLIPFKMS